MKEVAYPFDEALFQPSEDSKHSFSADAYKDLLDVAVRGTRNLLKRPSNPWTAPELIHTLLGSASLLIGDELRATQSPDHADCQSTSRFHIRGANIKDMPARF